MLPQRSSRKQPSKLAGLCFSIQLFVVWFVITNIILNLLSTSSTLSCRRVRSYPPSCFIITGRIIGNEQLKELPNGQLLSAKLQTEEFLTLTSEAVVLETTQGEIRFSPDNTGRSGVIRDFAQEINSFLQSSEAGSIEIWSGYESSFDTLFKIFGVITAILGINIYLSIVELKRPPKQQERSTFDQWADTSNRLSSLEQPTSKEIKLSPDHSSHSDSLDE